MVDKRNDPPHINLPDFIDEQEARQTGESLAGKRPSGGSAPDCPVVANPLNSFIVPSTDVVLLTDANRCAAVFASSAAPLGMMLSRGAITLLEDSWFCDDARTIAGAISARGLVPAHDMQMATEASRWLRHQPGLTLIATEPAMTSVSTTTEHDKRHEINLAGHKPLIVTGGRLISRQIAGHTVLLHEVATPLPDGAVPIIDTPLSIGISVDDDATPQFLPARVFATTGSKCPICAACASCTACILCAEVNYFVGTAGIVGVVSLTGLAGSLAHSFVPAPQ